MKLFLFTTHKTGSMFLHRLFSDVAIANGMLKVSNNDGNLDLTGETQYSDEVFGKEGIYAPLRCPVKEMPLCDEDYYIFHIRDPRDMLTSLFFSHAFSHPTREGGFNPDESMRTKWQDMGIDQFILNHVSNSDLIECYRMYLDESNRHKNSILSRYEVMVRDYPKWFLRIQKFLDRAGLEFSREQFLKFEAEFNLPKDEDVTRHKRKMLPGDFRNKLQQDTIDFLNDRFDFVLEAFSYSR